MASPAATDAAEPPDEPPGTVSRSHGLCVVKKPEFSVELPIANSSKLALPTNTLPDSVQRLHDRGAVRRHEALQYLRGAGRLNARRAEVVFHRQRDARQRRDRLARRQFRVHGVRLRARLVRRHRDVRLHPVLDAVNASEDRVGDFAGRDLPCGDLRGEFVGSEFVELHIGPVLSSTLRGRLFLTLAQTFGRGSAASPPG